MSAPRSHAETRRFWQRQVDAWSASGLSKAAFCRQADLQPASFGQWARRLSSPPSRTMRRSPDSLATMSMIPISVVEDVSVVADSAPSLSVIIERADISVTLPATLKAEHIDTWLTSLISLDVQH